MSNGRLDQYILSFESNTSLNPTPDFINTWSDIMLAVHEFIVHKMLLKGVVKGVQLTPIYFVH